MTLKLALASDHGGYDLKESLKGSLGARDLEMTAAGVFCGNVDQELCVKVLAVPAEFRVLEAEPYELQGI